MEKFKKPTSFYDDFDRKGVGQKITHYCPGCGHGTVHKLIGEVIEELGIQDRSVIYSPVGCTVFAYYYFDTGNIQCSHGRAPAVATGMRRTLQDAIIISYQGDGDLAGIGTTEIVHTANRGENITVFFVNNAIYGMTGGQMAPTTLLGQKTATTPKGRAMSQDGAPIGMAEIISSLKSPIYVERVAITTPGRIILARRAIKKAISNQVQKKGFSFVEILAACPTGWKMEAVDSHKWITEKLEPIFPVKVFRDTSDEVEEGRVYKPAPWIEDKDLIDLFQTQKRVTAKKHEGKVEDQLVKLSGFGGQGVMSAGVLLADCATAEGLNSTWLPSYGPEMRGGTANASVIVSEKSIGSPVIDYPNVLIVMNTPSLDTFEDKVQPGGLIIVNSSIIPKKVKRTDVKAVYVPASDLAKEEGFLGAANIIILSIYLLVSEVVDIETLKALIPVSIKKSEYVEINIKMVDKAIEYYEKNIKGKI